MTVDGRRRVRRALVSVSDKTGLEQLAPALHDSGVAIVSTGSTADRIVALGVPVTRVEQLTGFPETLGGRVKTLHPAIHAGLLADVGRPDHAAQLRELGIEPFDLLVANLYPFADTVGSGKAADDCIEQIDIGGPAMVRAAAKNHAAVAVVVSPTGYGNIVAALQSGGFTLDQRRRLAAEAFAHTATYDVHIASWLGNVVAPTDDGTGFPAWVGATWERGRVLRYGENPHQRAALYRSGFAPELGLAHADQLHGRELSYNNVVDADAAYRAVHDFDRPCVAVVKHTNPCGIALGVDVAEAHRKAHASDPTSAFGGVVAANRSVTAAMAAQLAEVFTEVIVAPDYDADALAELTRKRDLRVVRCPGRGVRGVELRPVSGGLLLQSADAVDAPGDDPTTWRLVSGDPVDERLLADLVFAWRSGRSVRSNAVVLAHDEATVGVGMGQVNRVDAARLAVARAGDRARKAVAASDAYFPFPDGVEVLAAAGVRAVVQPGGSRRDHEVLAVAESAGLTMYLTGTRHFTH